MTWKSATKRLHGPLGLLRCANEKTNGYPIDFPRINLVREKRSNESGLSGRKSGRPVSSKGTGRRLVWNRLGRIMDISSQKSDYLSG